MSRLGSVFTLAGMSAAQRTEYWASLALRYTAGLGPRKWGQLLAVYPSPYSAVLDVVNWKERAGIPSRLIHEFQSERWREQAKAEWVAAGNGGFRVLLWTDIRYPRRLKEITDPPLYLYYSGDTDLLANPGVGVVGSRVCSHDGLDTTRQLCRRLSASGVTTISGLARGIDSQAHWAALESWGSTIAVLGTGIDIIYPSENQKLADRITHRGLLLSEFAPGTRPEARNFPQRNRIISGLSLGVLVVEAAQRSGSLITAKHALGQGREVLAVPGRTQSKTSTGCHALIREGAKAVFSCDDVLVEIAPLIGINAEEFRLPEDVAPVPDFVAPRELSDSVSCESVVSENNAGDIGDSRMAMPTSENPEEQQVLDAMAGQDAIHIDDIGRALGWDAAKISTVLLMLEVQGCVRQLPGMQYSVIAV